MINAGSIGMPLHYGKVPGFLSEGMGAMGDAIIESIVDNYGKSEVLTRMSDPNWFQAFGAVTGMHWNSSGVTAVLMGALKRRINDKASDLGLYILGGKGKAACGTEKLADPIWDESGEPFEKRKHVPKQNGGGINSAIELPFPNLSDEQIDDGSQPT